MRSSYYYKQIRLFVVYIYIYIYILLLQYIAVMLRHFIVLVMFLNNVSNFVHGHAGNVLILHMFSNIEYSKQFSSL